MSVTRNNTGAVTDLPQTRDSARIADRYDDSRHLPPAILEEAYRRLEAQSLLNRGDKILDLGCGTGQLSLPLIERGYRVTGVDFAREMLERFRVKVHQEQWVTLVQADARRLPLPTHGFDIAVSSKLLMHVPRWDLAVAEIVRVIKSGGIFFHIYERGAFVNHVRGRFAAVCDALGFDNRHPSLQNSKDLAAYLVGLGAKPIRLGGTPLIWSKRVSYREAVEGFEQRLFGEFWELGDAIYDRILELVREWAKRQAQGLDTWESMTPSLEIEPFLLPKRGELPSS